jgi:hypothetical protein
MKTILILCLFFGGYLASQAQNSFSLGAKLGYGTSAFPMNATLFSDGLKMPARSGATLSTGAIGRYTIADKFGIESGAWFNHYSFYREGEFHTKDLYWKTAATAELINYQMPILINYKFKSYRHPFTYWIIVAGTTIDWFSTGGVSARESALHPQTLQNLVVAFRFGRERMKTKIEAGLEFQYSSKYFEFMDPISLRFDGAISSRINSVSFVINYFFFNKDRRNTNA